MMNCNEPAVEIMHLINLYLSTSFHQNAKFFKQKKITIRKLNNFNSIKFKNPFNISLSSPAASTNSKLNIP